MVLNCILFWGGLGGIVKRSLWPKQRSCDSDQRSHTFYIDVQHSDFWFYLSLAIRFPVERIVNGLRAECWPKYCWNGKSYFGAINACDKTSGWAQHAGRACHHCKLREYLVTTPLKNSSSAFWTLTRPSIPVCQLFHMNDSVILTHLANLSRSASRGAT